MDGSRIGVNGVYSIEMHMHYKQFCQAQSVFYIRPKYCGKMLLYIAPHLLFIRFILGWVPVSIGGHSS